MAIATPIRLSEHHGPGFLGLPIELLGCGDRFAIYFYKKVSSNVLPGGCRSGCKALRLKRIRSLLPVSSANSTCSLVQNAND